MSHADAPTRSPTLGADGRILEAIVTTCNADGSINISPMGPLVDETIDWLWLRPFNTSTTFRNLQRTGRGVLQVIDDVELIAHAAVGQPIPLPQLLDADQHDGLILADACRWFAFEVEWIDDATERTTILARVTDRGSLRDFFGFNRAKHAVLEAAILATRIHLIDSREIAAEFDRLKVIVDKTGAAAEHRAFAFLRAYIDQRCHGSQEITDAHQQ